MVLTSAFRSTGADLGHMDLAHDVELHRAVNSQHAGEAGGEARTHHDRRSTLTRLVVHRQQVADGVDVVTRRHHGNPATQERRRLTGLSTAGPGENDGIHVQRIRERPAVGDGTVTQTLGHRLEAIGKVIAQHDLVDTGRQELAGESGADGADAQDGDAGHVRSGPDSSRHPPDWGGVPPLPRSRSAAATSVANPRAITARRIIFIVGLAGIEPATSPLSGVRSNQLSYSPVGQRAR